MKYPKIRKFKKDIKKEYCKTKPKIKKKLKKFQLETRRISENIDSYFRKDFDLGI